MQGRGAHKQKLSTPSAVGTTKSAAIESKANRREETRVSEDSHRQHTVRQNSQVVKLQRADTVDHVPAQMNTDLRTCGNMQIKDSNEADVDGARELYERIKKIVVLQSQREMRL